MDPVEARDYHLPQVQAFADAGADLVSSLTLTTVNEAIGVALAAGEAGLPVSVGFTVETDGRLPRRHHAAGRRRGGRRRRRRPTGSS